MATAHIDKVEVEPAKPAVVEKVVALTLSTSEAEVVATLLAHTRDIDPDFPEVRAVFEALRTAGIRYNKLRLVDNDNGTDRTISVRLKKR